ncbi:MAG: hypothetical protein ACR2GB_02310 [Nocardioidaceae bacterium]
MSESGLITPWSARLTLHETVQRLQGNDRVLAISFLGSTGTEEWSEASDFDLCLLVSQYLAGMGVEATIVDRRTADVVVVDAHRAAALGRRRADPQTEPAPGTAVDAIDPDPDLVADAEWPFVRWLAQSRPVYDPQELARQACDRATRLANSAVEVDRTWQHKTRGFITHDLRVNATLLRRIEDPVVRVALGMRQLHTFVAAVDAWFTARDLHREGWKKDIAHIADADPAFFDIVERWLAAHDVTIRHELFREAVHRALDPIGGPLPNETVLPEPDDVWEALGTSG